jgi:hypothetical protein
MITLGLHASSLPDMSLRPDPPDTPEDCDGPIMLEIHLAGTITYVVDAVSAGGIEQRAAA